ncbi:MAG: fibronectin type III domain-containing protein [Eubacteriales bacterium]|nr:fibronectin type III domain-containing protein [Eubacteriales bacterium]
MKRCRLPLLCGILVFLLPSSARAAHTHLYNTPVYHWSSRAPYSCTATFTCSSPDCPDGPLTLPCSVTTKRIAATCTEDGADVYTATVTLDGGTLTNPETKSVILPKTGHKLTKESLTKATPSLAGLLVYQCDNCGERQTTEIARPKKAALSRTKYSYNGKSKKPSVTVTDSTGAVIASSHYTVTYPKTSSKVGTYYLSVKFRGSQYSGTLSKAASFSVAPRSTEIKTVKARSKGFSARWVRRQTQVTGYQISYAANRTFTKAKTKKFPKTATTSAVISKLSAKKTYYVRIRTYKTVKENGTSKNYYSAWSAVKKVKTKK